MLNFVEEISDIVADLDTCNNNDEYCKNNKLKKKTHV